MNGLEIIDCKCCCVKILVKLWTEFRVSSMCYDGILMCPCCLFVRVCVRTDEQSESVACEHLASTWTRKHFHFRNIKTITDPRSTTTCISTTNIHLLQLSTYHSYGFLLSLTAIISTTNFNYLLFTVLEPREAPGTSPWCWAERCLCIFSSGRWHPVGPATLSSSETKSPCETGFQEKIVIFYACSLIHLMPVNFRLFHVSFMQIDLTDRLQRN